MITAFLTGWLPYAYKSYKDRVDLLIEIENCEDSINNFDRNVYDKNNAGYITNKFKVMKIIDEYCDEYICANINVYKTK